MPQNIRFHEFQVGRRRRHDRFSQTDPVKSFDRITFLICPLGLCLQIAVIHQAVLLHAQMGSVQGGGSAAHNKQHAQHALHRCQLILFFPGNCREFFLLPDPFCFLFQHAL